MEIVSNLLKKKFKDDALKDELVKSVSFPQIRIYIIKNISKILNINIIINKPSRLNLRKKGNPFILKNGKFIRYFPEED